MKGPPVLNKRPSTNIDLSPPLDTTLLIALQAINRGASW